MDPRPLNVLLIIAGAQDEANIRQKLGKARGTSFAVPAVASMSAAFQQIGKNSCDVFVMDPEADQPWRIERRTPACFCTALDGWIKGTQVQAPEQCPIALAGCSSPLRCSTSTARPLSCCRFTWRSKGCLRIGFSWLRPRAYGRLPFLPEGNSEGIFTAWFCRAGV
jgi:hypothetical protein